MQRLRTIVIRNSGKLVWKDQQTGSIVSVAAAIVSMILLGGTKLACPQDEAPASHTAIAEAADPLFKEPYVDTDEWRETPVRHRYIHGGFKGVSPRFSIYLPPKERYRGRFLAVRHPDSGQRERRHDWRRRGRRKRYRTYSRLVFLRSAY